MSGRIVLKGKRSNKVVPTSLPMEADDDNKSVTLEECVSALESFPDSTSDTGGKPKEKGPCLSVPKRSNYERRRSPLAGDESPMDSLVVHPETFQAEPAQGFADGDGTESGNMEEAEEDEVSEHGHLRASSSKRPSTPSLLERKKTKVTVTGRERQHSATTSSSDEVFHSNMLGSTMSSNGGGAGGYTRLSTSATRKGGKTASADTEWSFDGISQLHSFFPERELTVFVGTWNMAEIKDLPPSLDDFLLPLTNETVADVCVVGAQECGCDIHEWEVLLQQTLGPSHVLVHSRQLGALHMVAFIRRDLLWHCSAVRSDIFSTKPGTPLRTKGGIGLCLSVFGSSFLFINCHLTAYDEKVAERNSDVARIAANLMVSLDDEEVAENSGDVCSRFDYVLWCGDLNYRVDLSRGETQAMLDKADYMSLLLQDQLTKEILKGSVFQGFSEQPINFPPSYKFDFHSNDYDSSEKQRIPSWTDRILFKSNNGGSLHGVGYSSCRSILHSDHRPVYGVFRASLSPSSTLDGIPNQIATFDVNVYNQANSHRKTMAATTLALRKQRSSSLQSAPSSSQQTNTAFCTLL